MTPQTLRFVAPGKAPPTSNKDNIWVNEVFIYLKIIEKIYSSIVQGAEAKYGIIFDSFFF